MQEKVLTLLGFASKSGNLIFGFDAAKAACLSGKQAKLIVTASDLSEKTKKEISYFAAKANVAVIHLPFDMETVSRATGRKGGILCVKDAGFANAIKGGTANGKNENQ